MDIELRCRTPRHASDCAEFLTSAGIRNAHAGDPGTPASRYVYASMTPGSVLRLADEALNHGWAHQVDADTIMLAAMR